MFTYNGYKYNTDINMGSILEITSFLGLVMVFGSLVWFAKRKEGISTGAIIALSLLFVASAGTMMLCRMSFVGVMSGHADDK